jgi:hypothetical protein
MVFTLNHMNLFKPIFILNHFIKFIIHKIYVINDL